jgi:hypothetical protein
MTSLLEELRKFDIKSTEEKWKKREIQKSKGFGVIDLAALCMNI